MTEAGGMHPPEYEELRGSLHALLREDESQHLGDVPRTVDAGSGLNVAAPVGIVLWTRVNCRVIRKTQYLSTQVVAVKGWATLPDQSTPLPVEQLELTAWVADKYFIGAHRNSTEIGVAFSYPLKFGEHAHKVTVQLRSYGPDSVRVDRMSADECTHGQI